MKIDALLELIYGEDKHLGERGEEKVHVCFHCGSPTYATRNNTQEKRCRRQNGSVTLRNEPAVVSLIKRWGRRSARKKRSKSPFFRLEKVCQWAALSACRTSLVLSLCGADSRHGSTVVCCQRSQFIFRVRALHSRTTHAAHSHRAANGRTEEVCLGSTYSVHQSHGRSTRTAVFTSPDTRRELRNE